jgi:hypothetical protein
LLRSLSPSHDQRRIIATFARQLKKKDRKTSDEKRGNPKIQGAQKERHPMKKGAISKCMGLKKKDLQ